MKKNGRPLGGKTDPAIREYWRNAKKKTSEEKETS
jgi:hypothetical protein